MKLKTISIVLALFVFNVFSEIIPIRCYTWIRSVQANPNATSSYDNEIDNFYYEWMTTFQDQAFTKMSDASTENIYDITLLLNKPSNTSLSFDFNWNLMSSDNLAQWIEYWENMSIQMSSSSYIETGCSIEFDLQSETNIYSSSFPISNPYDVSYCALYNRNTWESLGSASDGSSFSGILQAGQYNFNFGARVGDHWNTDAISFLFIGSNNITLSEVSVPEPSTIILLLSGLFAIAGYRKLILA